ncbi:EamA family transporter RarD [Candidatus Sororendozoicomonas aggregata]|uniref:EamA family transporter RarD n=1 Tax=Candidatus Sororendozoicomonas aggregata TaxID=3073239 RepID=UPI002ED40F97
MKQESRQNREKVAAWRESFSHIAGSGCQLNPFMNQTNKQGAVLAISAFVMWGLAPAYFKLLAHVPSIEIMMYRIVWSSLLLAIIVTASKNWNKIVDLARDKKAMLTLIASSSFLAFNWWLFIWAINNGHILEASLGYYINPLLNVALGMLFLGERLSKLHYASVALAVVGVMVQVVTFGSFPFVAIGLATSFSIYGLIRKTVAIDSISGLTIESLVLLLPGVMYWCFYASSPESNMVANDLTTNVIIVMAGVVTTAPLLCFVAASRRLTYSTLGFFQYIGPSIMFLMGVLHYGEQVGQDRWLTFIFIWSALALFSVASYRTGGVTQS